MGHEYSPRWRTTAVAILRPLLFALMKRDWKGQENVPGEGGVIIAANHLSWSDPLALGHYVYESGRFPVYLAKSGLFHTKVIGPILTKLGQIPVYRDRAEASLALSAAEEALRAGECLMFYPESTCTRDPELWPMSGQTGVARLALTTGAKVVPVAHWGAHELWPYGTKSFRPLPRKTMRILAGPPVDLSAYEGLPLTKETLRAATDDIMRTVAAQLGELRGEKPPGELYDHHKAVEERRSRLEGEQAS
jgi:1-acyl-sn-glycerol-3-phosphate acyltransferase